MPKLIVSYLLIGVALWALAWCDEAHKTRERFSRWMLQPEVFMAISAFIVFGWPVAIVVIVDDWRRR